MFNLVFWIITFTIQREYNKIALNVFYHQNCFIAMPLSWATFDDTKRGNLAGSPYVVRQFGEEVERRLRMPRRLVVIKRANFDLPFCAIIVINRKSC